MAKDMNQLDDAAYEAEFSRRNTLGNFKMQLFGAFSGATFIAALGVIANKIIGASEGLVTAAADKAPSLMDAARNAFFPVAEAPAPSFFGSLFANPTLTIPLLIGMAAIGVTTAYMAVAEGTEMKKLQDDRLARQNAKAQQQCHQQTLQPIIHEQNSRSDGKAWSQVVANENHHIAHSR